MVVERAKEGMIPIRIGVNAGSLDKKLVETYGHSPQAMVESALKHIKILEDLNYDHIKVSLKASNIPMMLEAYRILAQKVDYPLHIGVTEAGTIRSGTIKSAVGIGALLAEGIGDTLRVSLTGDPIHEIPVAYEILKALELRTRGPVIISCPTCGRTEIGLIEIAEEIENRLANVKKPIKVAIMGCVVNGPGEAREADIGIAGGKGVGLIFKKGEVFKKVKEEELIDELMKEIQRMDEEETN
jgi:(E)-4-hydroxy-3-methylbut-2-enyl-diphosphate synthase